MILGMVQRIDNNSPQHYHPHMKELLKILDCETFETTYVSMQQILGIDRQDIESALVSLDIEALAEKHPHVEPQKHALSCLLEELPYIPIFDRTCWFHLTRTVPGNTFEEGILPLGQHLDSIWQFLGDLLPTTLLRNEWPRFRRNMGSSHSAHLYSMKVANPLHWGPHGVLVKDTAFCPRTISSHDYLNTPEIVEDICMCFQEKHSFDLLTSFHKNTKPCIVKFISEDNGERILQPVANYLWSNLHEQELSTASIYCYDSCAKPVLKDRILDIDFVDYP